MSSRSARTSHGGRSDGPRFRMAGRWFMRSIVREGVLGKSPAEDTRGCALLPRFPCKIGPARVRPEPGPTDEEELRPRHEHPPPRSATRSSGSTTTTSSSRSTSSKRSTSSSARARSAAVTRATSSACSTICARPGGSLSKGVKTKSGGFLRVAIPNKRPELPTAIDKSAMDNAILQTAIEVRDEDVSHPTVFVTMDTNLRIRADALGVLAETYENQRVEPKGSVENGVTEIEVSAEEIDSFFQDGSLAPNAALIAPERGEKHERSANTNGDTGARHPHRQPLRAASRSREPVAHGARPLRRDQARDHRACARRARACMGIRPRNKEQSHALDLLLDENIRLVTLVGKAGTGKTLLALAAGLKRTVEDGMYTRMLVSRPVMPLGRDIGFLPGDVDEKLNPWMQPIFDNLEFLFSSGTKQGPARLRRAARERPAPGRAAHVHPRALAAAAVHHRRRGAEPHAARGEDDHHALRRRNEDRAHGRSRPDRQPVRRQPVERARRRGRSLPRREDRRAHRPQSRRAQRARRDRRQPPLIRGLALSFAEPPRADVTGSA